MGVGDSDLMTSLQESLLTALGERQETSVETLQAEINDLKDQIALLTKKVEESELPATSELASDLSLDSEQTGQVLGESNENPSPETERTSGEDEASQISEVKPIDYELFSYPGADHNLQPENNWNQAIQRDLTFLSKHLQ